MRAAFYSYPSAFQNPGGGEVQLIKTGEYLRKAGVEVKLFDQWKDKLEDFDILHVFGSVKDCTGLMAAARNRGVKVVLSPIFWSGLKRALREEGDILKKTGLLARHAVKRVFPYFPSGRRETMELSDIMLPNSIMEAEQITKLFGISRRKMAVVPNGVDLRFMEA
ncbi:MAG TPA: glycosyltransferase family 4 protein, partial [Candidatus Omnitrophota bacterium]|nr:glycosyltransferase family 4 protein [Candidatus Omnitrophota bacterium]